MRLHGWLDACKVPAIIIMTMGSLISLLLHSFLVTWPVAQVKPKDRHEEDSLDVSVVGLMPKLPRGSGPLVAAGIDGDTGRGYM